MDDDPYDLQRFVDAQDAVFDHVIEELSRGRKRTHWMWFVFPQLGALGRSAMSRHYGIGSREEARAYLDHPVLRDRLVHCVDLLLKLQQTDAHAIFGVPDDMKLRSCLTLFSAVAPDEPVFADALQRFFPEGPDPQTLSLLR
jgi:uncharacterized protein (DUF1810 family)